MGSARLRSTWLESRYKWLQDGVPLEPDWSLIPGSSAAQDLLDWDAAHGSSVVESEEDYLCDMSELPDTMRRPCIEAGILKLPPSLLKVAWRRERSLSQQAREDLAQKRHQKQLVATVKKTLSDKLKEALRQKLQDISRQQALQRMVPRAGVSMRPKLVKKNAKRSRKKQAIAGLASSKKKVAALAEGDPHTPECSVPAPGSPPPLPPPAQPPAKSKEGPLQGVKVALALAVIFCF